MSTKRIRGKHEDVNDADCHVVEFLPLVADIVKRIGGIRLHSRFESLFYLRRGAYDSRRLLKSTRGPWWSLRSDVTSLAAASLAPALMNGALAAAGIRSALVMPTFGLIAPHLRDAEERTAFCRAFNIYASEIVGEM